MVVDAAVIWAGDGAQLDAAILDFQRLDLLSTVRAEAVLQIDARERRRELTRYAPGAPTKPAKQRFFV